MNLIDTHAHLQFRNYDSDREKVFRQCKDENVGMILVGCDYASSVSAVEHAETHKIQRVWAAVGQHPTDTDIPFVKKDFHALAKKSVTIVAIGECGLDYYHLPAPHEDELRKTGGLPTTDALKDAQKVLLREHVALSGELHLPLIIHCRDAHEDMLELLIAYYSQAGREPLEQKREHGVMHCFTGNAANAQAYLALGFLISFTGIITFTKLYDDVVKCVPLDKILIETDSPFLTPSPFRGKKNNPIYVKYVAQRIAEIKGVSPIQVAQQTTNNAKRLFSL